MEKELVSEKRGYLLRTVAEAKEIVLNWLREINLVNAIKLGLPEVDDRYHIWRVPLCNDQKKTVGEVVIDAYTTEILADRTTRTEIIIARLLKQDESKLETRKKTKKEYKLSSLRNTIGFGDCGELLEEMPAESVDLIFTSPPYFNARPEYSEFEEYESYLLKLRQVIRKCHRVLSEGRFFVINISPVLLRRASRNQASKRIAVPFDLHRIFVEEGYDFIDDIIWLKPEGAGWATGRGRRFAADRNPLQYKTVPVTEYVLVYRKHTDLLIDWHIRNHPDQEVVKASKIADGYERTNVWKINPVTNSKHPAAFPVELAEKVITYYSFKGDVVLDPFAGSGTVGLAAASLDRRFVLFESNFNYIELIRKLITEGSKTDLDSIIWLNCPLEN
ncbi:MAG: site-specific DNA-methyltransferase [Microcystis sp. M114S2]|uniref:DNA-methyltransferase n=1 Tax=unclassified Microcystis TaxID=2643300 RepID=UPI0025840802|nr:MULTISPECIES: site-specific DNA-methyltransferase [unclassified Microcystis]MCA2667221.1 site-specific DNA-methyltransferase [Microcystis sp. M045S2]MCA2715881.1 site-specific DNA-methyltransferase [Microcystis sp. M172S2]MCA2804070.1 site-specific DNA-methyltransferase [Microcystis sp. M114S2]MCA2832071.1 site-specific DNA-methyltransferase [Microcystis sp. M007S1]MCA2840316.1 site-specific DNA-methyltransferase [Microcystis sp. M078S1]